MQPAATMRGEVAIWSAVAAVGVVGLVLLATNRGFYNADELDLLQYQAPWWEWQWFEFGKSLFYRPLGYALFTVQLHAVSGEPMLVHTISVLHHVANLVLFAVLLGRFGLPRRIALLAFLPSAVPGVAWVAGVYDRSALTLLLLCALLLTMRRAAVLLAVMVFAVALTTKETALGFAVPAVLIAWWRRRDADRAWVLASVSVIAAAALAFAIWRIAAVPRVPEYAVAFDRSNVLRLARLVVFPFSLGSNDPSNVWGWRWVGAIGSAALFAIALRGSVRWTLAGVAIAGAAIAPIAMLPKVEGHYLYLATPGLLLIAAAAMRDTARGSRVLLCVLLVTSFVHSLQITFDYRILGTAMTGLQRAHRAAARQVAPFEVHGRPWHGETAVRRYQVHAKNCALQPPVQIAVDRSATGWIVEDDGSVYPPRSPR